jgi:YVTN family beta-propeller protein
MFNDPDNMLINLALQTQENLAGKMVITSDSKTVYAISQSGFLILPVSTVYSNPIAAADTNVVLLENDQCGVTAQFKLGMVNIKNQGQGQLTVTATLQSSTANAVTPPLAGGPGGQNFPGVPVFIIGGPGGTTVGGPNGPGPNVPVGTMTPVATASSTAPTLEIVQTDSGPALQFTYNSNNASSLGTVTPHDFAVQAFQAINIPPRIRVYQNNRNAEAAGTILPVPVGVSTSEGLMDIVAAASRHLLFIANAGLNRVEVFDTQAMQFLNPIKVGQLPHSLALSPDGSMLYVANTGGENISIIDTNQLKVTGQLTFPAVPFNASFGVATPRQIAVTQS